MNLPFASLSDWDMIFKRDVYDFVNWEQVIRFLS